MYACDQLKLRIYKLFVTVVLWFFSSKFVFNYGYFMSVCLVFFMKLQKTRCTSHYKINDGQKMFEVVSHKVPCTFLCFVMNVWLISVSCF